MSDRRSTLGDLTNTASAWDEWEERSTQRLCRRFEEIARRMRETSLLIQAADSTGSGASVETKRRLVERMARLIEQRRCTVSQLEHCGYTCVECSTSASGFRFERGSERQSEGRGEGQSQSERSPLGGYASWPRA